MFRISWFRAISCWSLLCSFYLLFPTAAFSSPKAALLSAEGTFSLNGPDSLITRRFFKTLAGYEKQFYQLTGYSSGDAPPVVVVVHDQGDNFQDHAVLRMDCVEGTTPRIQVDIPAERLETSSTRSELAEAMLLRQYYNGKSPPPGATIASFPGWLLHGLGKLSDPETSVSLLPATYIRGGSPPSIPDLLVQKIPDKSNTSLLEIYDSMAAELLTAGFKEQGGNHALRDWISRYDFDTPRRDPSSWPPGWEMQSVERRWLLLMAGKSGEDSGVVSLLSVPETLARYDEILDEVTTPGHSFALMKKEKGAVFLIQQLMPRLIALRLLANPMADPLIDQRIQLCTQFKRMSFKKIAEKETRLSALRNEVLKHIQSIEAYLDWFEATKLPVKSGLFDSLLNQPDLPVQKGPIGHYLDTVESRGW